MDGRRIAAAAIQMSSTPEKTENFGTAERLIREAASAGAELVALPELWSCHGLEEVYEENTEIIPGPTTDFLGGLARELGLYVLGGSILEGEPGAGDVEDLALVGDGDVDRRGARLEEAHALAAAGDEEGLCPELRAQPCAGVLDPSFVFDPEPGGLGSLLEVRGRGADARVVEQPVSGIEADVAALREAHHGFGNPPGEGALAVIGEDKTIHLASQVFDAPRELVLGRGAGSAGPELINAQEVLAEAAAVRTARDDARLRDGPGVRVPDHGACVASGGAEYLRELVAAQVRPDPAGRDNRSP